LVSLQEFIAMYGHLNVKYIIASSLLRRHSGAEQVVGQCF